ncbi:hypothetical protein N473_12895 [Pseudoalteromonas luteoviolacea CPMOR-1]|uniref:Uncharacterized protein n=1 Tax=Pseudoalteromonas luteoviolacea CPMOR-1 TaxID=1365248 RepID=A0A167LNR4_9GAMM|nr:hypothetical protein [Pseudoalteromonas luteoviolacea]KZN64929.1 hypothetical protein N473_12895 [Pseudoalteromonas luteoviolacea CPMOR-1]
MNELFEAQDKVTKSIEDVETLATIAELMSWDGVSEQITISYMEMQSAHVKKCKQDINELNKVVRKITQSYATTNDKVTTNL